MDKSLLIAKALYKASEESWLKLVKPCLVDRSFLSDSHNSQLAQPTCKGARTTLDTLRSGAAVKALALSRDAYVREREAMAHAS